MTHATNVKLRRMLTTTTTDVVHAPPWPTEINHHAESTSRTLLPPLPTVDYEKNKKNIGTCTQKPHLKNEACSPSGTATRFLRLRLCLEGGCTTRSGAELSRPMMSKPTRAQTHKNWKPVSTGMKPALPATLWSCSGRDFLVTPAFVGCQSAALVLHQKKQLA